MQHPTTLRGPSYSCVHPSVLSLSSFFRCSFNVLQLKLGLSLTPSCVLLCVLTTLTSSVLLTQSPLSSILVTELNNVSIPASPSPFPCASVILFLPCLQDLLSPTSSIQVTSLTCYTSSACARQQTAVRSAISTPQHSPPHLPYCHIPPLHSHPLKSR